MQDKTKLVFLSQANWTISRKELEVARLCAELVLAVSKPYDWQMPTGLFRSIRSLQGIFVTETFRSKRPIVDVLSPITIRLGKTSFIPCLNRCSIFLAAFTCGQWTNLQVAFKWILNPNLYLPRIVKRYVYKVSLMNSASDWSYVNPSLNPDDIVTLEGRVRNSDFFGLWLDGPRFLLQGVLEPRPVSLDVVVRIARINVDLLSLKSNTSLDGIIESAPDLYALKKREAYLIAFQQ